MVYCEHTLKRFPLHPKMKDDCALPFGMSVCPFAQMPDIPVTRTPKLQLAEVPRCSECLGYINCFSGLDTIGWRCSLCGSYNEYVNQQGRRYSRSTARDVLQELNDHVYEVMCEAPSAAADATDSGGALFRGPFPVPREGHPVFVAVVDTSGCADYLELVKTALAAALQALPPIALVGLITVSDQIGLWDLKGIDASVRNVPVFDDGRVMATLEDVLPLRCLLTPIENCQSSISAALEMLAPTQGGKLAFGASMHAILDYLNGLKEGPVAEPHPNQRDSYRYEAHVQFGPARVACFLSGASNMGLGSAMLANGSRASVRDHSDASYVGHVSTAPAPQQQVMEMGFAEQDLSAVALDPDAAGYYEQLAVVAAIEGVCVDIFAVGPHFCGLVCLVSLCEKTGGSLHFYPTVEDSALPQDLYKRLQGPHALAGLLRVRCCPELRIKQSYGRLFPDPDHEQLYHLVSCDAKESLAFDLDFTSHSGFLSDNGNKVTHPVIQFAFQYSVLVPQPAAASADAAPSAAEPAAGSVPAAPLRYEMQRRMRIATFAPRLAKSNDIIYANAQADVITKVLMHKVLHCQAEEGRQEARKLLQDWFVIMCSRYHNLINKIPYGATPQPGQIDVMLGQCEALAPMATLTYALLRSPLLGSSHRPDSDVTAYLKLLWGGLPPNELQRVLYPLLISFQTPDDKAHVRHMLSLITLRSNTRPILLMDAFHVILVMYRHSCAADVPFPPPPDSHIRNSIHSLKQSRKIAPKVVYAREGDPEAAILNTFLIDEPQGGVFTEEAANEASSMGFAKWSTHIQNDIQKYMGEESNGA